MHSPCELVHLKDLDDCAKLIAKTVEKIGPRTSFVLHFNSVVQGFRKSYWKVNDDR